MSNNKHRDIIEIIRLILECFLNAISVLASNLDAILYIFIGVIACVAIVLAMVVSPWIIIAVLIILAILTFLNFIGF